MRFAYPMLIMSAALFLGGCPAVVAGVAAPGILHQDRVNLLNASYAAADTLAQRSERRFSVLTPLVVANPVEIPDMSKKPVVMNGKVGNLLGDQLRERFTLLGYNVVDVGRYPGAGKYGEVTGSYEIKDGTMSVSLRMAERNSGKLLASYDYALPVTYDIKKYMTPKENQLPPIPPIF